MGYLKLLSNSLNYPSSQIFFLTNILGQIGNTFTLLAIFDKPFFLLPSEEDDILWAI